MSSCFFFSFCCHVLLHESVLKPIHGVGHAAPKRNCSCTANVFICYYSGRTCFIIHLRHVDLPEGLPGISVIACDNAVLSVVRDGVPVNHVNESNHLEVNRN